MGQKIADNWQLYLLLIPLSKKCGMDGLLQVNQDAYDRCSAAK